MVSHELFPWEKKMPLIEIRNLSVSFKKEDNTTVDICKNFDLVINEGEICGLVGSSGSGKSVIIKAIAGIYDNTCIVKYDRFRFGNTDLVSLNQQERRRFLSRNLAVMLQNGRSSLDPHLTIKAQMKENLTKSARPDKWYKRFFWRGREINILLHKVGIKDTKAILNAYPHELSEVQCRKVMIAIALGRKPRLLIADDPISSMTSLSQLQILRLLDSLNQNNHVSILFVTNDLGPSANLMDRIYMIYFGHIMEQASTENILTKPKHPFTEFMLNAIPDLGTGIRRKSLLKIPFGDTPDFQHPPIGCPLGNRCPYADRECNLFPKITKVKNGFYFCHFPLNTKAEAEA